ncbi:glutamate synthase subunit beta [Rhodococcus aetherivorans]|uniref:glutamate synthase subunit beta n=1 Tax=unclassified Rhodococcus (in: high G+C Gram-positive bacteria) TaxID=192944 RepID=UPI00081A74CB|nr:MULTISPECIES: glutamate synthase subunit beta [unclassified Rhodococcus (in: high G+C Gram-positive bacteria)]ANZ24975.1 glutamate synthase [Rhodococcus sp. WB1]USC13211.1 glutamate synthase subunit beta [Rhodococcus sp. 11-3]
MPDPRGFLRYDRREPPRRPAAERVRDWAEVHRAQPPDEEALSIREQAARCMDCGIPFCHSAGTGCPLGNLIPEWNDLVRRDLWAEAADRLHATDNFPEFTGRLCPAPCESACVLARDDHTAGVTVERIERAIADRAWADGRVPPRPPARGTGRSVAVVGSGPAGLAAAQQLTRAGHAVTVLERADRLGGLLRYGIPAFKMDKALVDRRLAQMRAEGTVFRTGTEAGIDPDVATLRAGFDAVVLAVGAGRARDLAVPGRELGGVHPAMEYLVAANHECEGDGPAALTAAGRHVVIVGGGDTGADCFGTALRQGARSVTQLDYRPRPPGRRDEDVTPWPLAPWVLRTAPAHEEGGTRRFEVTVQRFVGSRGRVRALELAEVDARRLPLGDPFEIPCDLALLAVGFEGVQRGPLLDALGLTPGVRGTLDCDERWQTSAPGVFVCGDAHRGASLVVWAIAEGRAAARGVDAFLTGESALPAPVHPRSLHLDPRRFPARPPG